MHTQLIHRKQIIILVMFITVVIVLTTTHKIVKPVSHVQLGDQVAVFNAINHQGVEESSVLVIYNSDFSKQKMLIKLDDIYYSVDQISNTLKMENESTLVFRVYNESSYQDVTLDLKNDTLSKSKVTNEHYNGDKKLQINIYTNHKFELTKPDLYMVIDDPNLTIDSIYYSLSDTTQITNYINY